MSNQLLLPGQRTKIMADCLTTKFESFKCEDVHHSECVFTNQLREELIGKFGNISYTEQWLAVCEAFKTTSRKRKGKDRKSVYCGIRLLPLDNALITNLNQEICEMTKQYEREARKRKRAEQVANNYYREWKAEQAEKDKAMEAQVHKTVAILPNSLFIPSELLVLECNGDNKDIVLGSGVYGSVNLCQYKGNYVAVKCLKSYSKLEPYHSGEQEKQAMLRNLFHEAKILLNLKCHENLPTLLGVSVDNEPLKIVMQFYGIEQSSVSLFSLFKDRNSLELNKDQWHFLFNKVAKGIHHVHCCGFLHNDIKADNVIIQKNNDVYVPVLIDFGKSCKLYYGATKHLSKKEQIVYRNKYRHVAPEVVDASHKQSIYSDIYSFGYLVHKIHSNLPVCKESIKLKEIVKKCYSVKTWSL